MRAISGGRALNVFALFIGFGLGSFVFGAALNAGFAALGIFSGAQLLGPGAATRLFSEKFPPTCSAVKK